MANVSPTLRIAALVAACAAIPATARPQAPPDAVRHNAEERIGQAAFKVVDLGIPLYNTQRDYAGCYWLYRGALLSYVPLLSGYPAQAEVLKALKDAEARPDAASKATALRVGMDAVARLRKAVAPTSLWARLGGEPAVSAVVHDFVAKTAGNPRVDFTRGNRYPIDARGSPTWNGCSSSRSAPPAAGPTNTPAATWPRPTRAWPSPTPSSAPWPRT